jgi:ubiquinone biosynthesis protein
MAEQVGWRGLAERLKAEAPRFGQIFPQLPRLIHQVLHKHAHSDVNQGEVMAMLLHEQRRTNRLLIFIACVSGLLAALAVGVRWHGGF